MKALDIYRKLSALAEMAAVPILKRLGHKEDRSRAIWEQRLGHLPEGTAGLAPFDLWIHAVSVGELTVAEALVKRIQAGFPSAQIVVSSFTETGLERAERLFQHTCQVVAYPLDLPHAAEKAVRTLRPRAYGCIETELWPNLVSALKRHGTRTLLLNARISPKSFRAYKRITPLIRPVLNQFDHICAISKADSDRLKELGAERERIEITGNAKYELLIENADPVKAQALRKRLAVSEDIKVVVLGSLRSREHEMILPALREILARHNDVFFITAPRHMNKIPETARQLRDSGIGFCLLSDVLGGTCRCNLRDTRVLLADKIGYLFTFYGMSACAFVGGSLVPKGGQNIMEPAAWARPVLFGPYIHNFQEAALCLLKSGGGIQIKDPGGLVSALDMFLSHQEISSRKGRQARKALEKLAGRAATIQAQRLLEFLR